jgi:hypothetical protein
MVLKTLSIDLPILCSILGRVGVMVMLPFVFLCLFEHYCIQDATFFFFFFRPLSTTKPGACYVLGEEKKGSRTKK